MAEYLVDNPPARPQYRVGRRAQVSGVFLLHSAENLTDLVAPDTGAEAVARMISRRTDAAGSYHTMCDSDSRERLVPFGWEAFHVGTHRLNWHSIGVSGAFRAHQLAALRRDHPRWVEGLLHQMGMACREGADYVEHHTGVKVPARRITLAQAIARAPGFLTHGMADPGRRSDPDGTRTGDRWLWDPFFDAYTSGQRPPAQQTTTAQEGTMAAAVERIRAGYREVRGPDYDPTVRDAPGWRHWMDALLATDTTAGVRAVVEQCMALLWLEAVRNAEK